MPTTRIDYSRAHEILNQNAPSSATEHDGVVSTPYGLSILEIQGELNLPTHAPSTDHQDVEYVKNFITVDQACHAVKCGNLEFDTKDPHKVTLFIGKSQRLLGSMVDLDTPLAVLKVPLQQENGENVGDKGIQIVDIIRKKLVFKQRPLPIM